VLLPANLPLTGGVPMELDNIQITEGDGRLIVGVDFESGIFGMHGRMYIEGTPYLTANKRALGVTDLRFEVDTHARLAEVASELAGPAILQMLGERLKVDLEPHYLRATAQAGQRASDIALGDGVRLSTTIDSVKLEDVAIGGGKLALVASAHGTAVITVP
jgi:hypothetical protein